MQIYWNFCEFVFLRQFWLLDNFIQNFWDLVVLMIGICGYGKFMPIVENLFFTTSDFFQSKNYSVIFYWRFSEVFLHAHAGFRTVDRLVGSGSRAVIGNEGSQAVIGNVAQSLLKMAD